MDIYLIRHTRVAVATGICYGQSDVALADSYPDEWAALRRKLPDADADRVFSSPLSRCLRLAEHLCVSEVTIDARLIELNFGQWELRPWDDIDRRESDAWSADVVDRRCPGGESYREQFRRAAAFWDECAAERHGPRCVFVIAHGGLIRALLARILEIPLEKSLCLSLDYGSVSKVHFVQDVPIVDYVNR